MSEDAISKVIAETKELSQINLIENMKVGKAIKSKRKIVDDSFTFGIIMEFSDIETMNKYLNHDVHVKYVKSVLKPVLRKVVVYDFYHTWNI